MAIWAHTQVVGGFAHASICSFLARSRPSHLYLYLDWLYALQNTNTGQLWSRQRCLLVDYPLHKCTLRIEHNYNLAVLWSAKEISDLLLQDSSSDTTPHGHSDVRFIGELVKAYRNNWHRNSLFLFLLHPQSTFVYSPLLSAKRSQLQCSPAPLSFCDPT